LYAPKTIHRIPGILSILVVCFFIIGAPSCSIYKSGKFAGNPDVSTASNDVEASKAILNPTIIPTFEGSGLSIFSPGFPAFAPISPPHEEVWYTSLDEHYFELNHLYARVIHPASPIYSSLDEARNRSSDHRHSLDMITYVSYISKVSDSGQTYYEIDRDSWMSAEDIVEAIPSRYSGLVITQPVNFRFGWLIKDVQSVSTHDIPSNSYRRYQFFREYNSAQVKPGFVAIGPDEWILEASVALITPNVEPVEGVWGCRWLQVDLGQQTLSVYQDCRLVFATLISSGQKPLWTQSGLYSIFNKYDYHTITSPSPEVENFYFEDTPYVMYYTGVWALHGVYWHDQFGYPASHGCINLSPADAHWLFEWTALGDKIVIINKTRTW
jgi:hypothetical protein